MSKLLKVSEVAELLGIGTRTLRRLTAPNGDLPCVRVGGQIRYDSAVIEQWTRDRRVG